MNTEFLARLDAALAKAAPALERFAANAGDVVQWVEARNAKRRGWRQQRQQRKQKKRARRARRRMRK